MPTDPGTPGDDVPRVSDSGDAEASPAPPSDPPQPPPIERYDDGVIAVDTLTGGMSDVTAGYLLDAPRPTLIECGPAKPVAHLVSGLHELGMDPDDLAYLVLTHIHLDHAGGAGDVAAAFPNATVVVSEVGARHLHDPSRLNRSARQVYGELFDSVYGACTPIEAQRIVGVADGDTLDLGGGRHLELMYTPGHAKHHVGVHDSATDAIFSGDSVGVKLPGMTHLRPATPPADFHLEAALNSLDRYRERSPSRVYLAHYGPVDPPDDALAEAEDRLRLWASTAEAAYYEALVEVGAAPTGTELDHVAETLRRRFADEVDASLVADDPDAVGRLELLSGVESNAAGLVRYFQRRDDGTLTDVG
jgi:glyoxylase-like metal-dependent hydrolase (beta-lactamase superfamily II)